MPELPDVEVFKRYLDRTALHATVREVTVHTPKVLHGVSAATLRQRVPGHELAWSRRHGKLLFVGLDHGPEALVLHFGMTGFLKYYASDEDAPDHPRVEFRLDDGHILAFDCQRMFGEVDLADDVEGYLQARAIGPDALSLDEDGFVDRLQGRRGAIKTTLMKQGVMAGIGNVYSDEILFHAHLHPDTDVAFLDESELRKLHRRMRHVLERAIEAKADPGEVPRTWLLPHRRQGATCPRCGAVLERKKIGQRHAWLCPSHQSKK